MFHSEMLFINKLEANVACTTVEYQERKGIWSTSICCLCNRISTNGNSRVFDINFKDFSLF